MALNQVTLAVATHKGFRLSVGSAPRAGRPALQTLTPRGDLTDTEDPVPEPPVGSHAGEPEGVCPYPCTRGQHRVGQPQSSCQLSPGAINPALPKSCEPGWMAVRRAAPRSRSVEALPSGTRPQRLASGPQLTGQRESRRGVGTSLGEGRNTGQPGVPRARLRRLSPDRPSPFGPGFGPVWDPGPVPWEPQPQPGLRTAVPAPCKKEAQTNTVAWKPHPTGPARAADAAHHGPHRWTASARDRAGWDRACCSSLSQRRWGERGEGSPGLSLHRTSPGHRASCSGRHRLRF